MRGVNGLHFQFLSLVLFLDIQLIKNAYAVTFTIYNGKNDKKEWTDANDFCKEKGGLLAVVNTEDKRRELQDQLPKGGHFWIGFRELSGSRQWADKSANNFTCGITSKDNKKCCTIQKTGKSFKYQGKKCDHKEKFVCGKTAESSIQTQISSVQKSTSKASQTTLQPTPSPTTLQPTPSPTTLQPARSPTTLQPTPSTTLQPAPSPTTLQPTPSPTTLQPTPSPTTLQPAPSPTTLQSTPSPTTLQSTPSTTLQPAPSPTTLQPTPSSTTRTTLTKTSTHTPKPSTSNTNTNINTQSHVLPSKTSEVIVSSTGYPGIPSTISSSTSDSRQNAMKMIEDFHKFINSLDAKDPGAMEDLMNEYDDFIDEIEPDELDEDDFNPMMEAQSIESFAMKFALAQLGPNKTRLNIDAEDIGYLAEIVERGKNSNVIVSTDKDNGENNYITMPKELFQEKDNVIVVSVVFKNDKNDTLRKSTPKIFEGSSMNYARMNTKIMSLSTYPKLKEPLDENILIAFQHIQANAINDPASVYCSFWNYSIPSSYNGSWSGRGCKVKSTTGTRTVCECNHMTNFAVLMQLRPEKKIDKKHEIALTTITYVGLALSFIGEAVTVFCYFTFFSRNKHNDKIQIRINLLCTLASAQLVMMAGLSQTKNKGVCVFIAAFIHYFYLASFCWMLMEAVILYKMVVKVYDIVLRMRYSYLFCYGFPLMVVLLALFLAEICTGGIHTYSNKNFCWVNSENKLIWSFATPVLIIIVINSILLTCVLKEMFSIKPVKTGNSSEMSMIRASVRACVVILPLLGLTWLFGLLSLAGIGIAWQYVFTILNATQGFVIFVVHCLRNSELKSAIKLRFNQWQSNHSNINYSKEKATPDVKHLHTKNRSENVSPRNSVPMTSVMTNKVMPNNTL